MPRVGKYWLSLELYYAPFDTAHTWAKAEPDGKVRVGVDDFAQKQAGDILFVRLFPVGKTIKQGARFGTMETAKWVGPLISPVSGTISAVNEEVQKSPKLINEEPYGKGWMVVITPTNFEEDSARLVQGDKATAWLKKEIEEMEKKKA
jgi:glycine cleavage system H protein